MSDEDDGLPPRGKYLDLSLDSSRRIRATWGQLTPEEQAAVEEAVQILQDGLWRDLLWFEDLVEEGLVEMFVAQDVILVWRVYPDTDDVAQVIYVGHPHLYR